MYASTYESFMTQNPDSCLSSCSWERNEYANEREAAIDLSLEAAHHLHSALHLLEGIASLKRVDLFGLSLQESMEQLSEMVAMLEEAGTV